MQILFVHRDAEVGEELVRLIKEYTEHHCGLANSGAGALDWARGVPRCSLLIMQLQAEGVNGLALGGTLSEIFAGLQTMFLPDYPATEQRLEVPHAKVFPEPIDGARLLEAIARAEEQRRTGMDLYHALDLLQMCCLAGRSGAVQLVKGSQTAVVYLLGGRIVHAERGPARGADALYEIVPWEAVEFAYDYAVRAPVHTITGAWHEAVIGAVARRKAQVVGTTPPVAAEPARKQGRWGLFGGARKP
ncbi:MAG: DUF4388 domain-containing protein [Chthoniobacterales bacterium]